LILLEAKALKEALHYNHVRSHGSLAYRPLAPKAVITSKPKTILLCNLNKKIPNFESGTNNGVAQLLYFKITIYGD
jgi:hypothetical protein